MSVVLASLLIAVLLLAAALLVPVDVRAQAAAADELNAQLRVEWLYGWLGRDVTAPNARRRRKPPERRWPTRAQLELLADEALRERFTELLRRAQRWVSIEELTGRLRFGLADPVATGLAYGWLAPLLAIAQSQPVVQLRIDPDFGDAVLDGELRGWVRAVPLGVLLALAGFALSPEARHSFRRWRALRT